MRKIITTAAAAKKLGVTQRHIQELCRSGRIPQASRFGRDWLMPENFKVLPVRRGRPPKK
jgi:excisionase family DNA binding protein